MARLTVRNIDDDLKSRLRLQAARHGCSMEEEVRRILRESLEPKEAQSKLGSRLHARILQLSGGAEPDLPPRSTPRPEPDFGAKDK